jgi:transcriptional regulator with XRE-family HTH domain
LETLRYMREQAGYSQQDLADESGVSQHTISEIELGRRKPQGRTLRKLAKTLGVEVANLRGSSEPPLAKAPPSSTQPPLNGFEEARRAKATGRSVEERVEISTALASAIENLTSGYRVALEQYAGAAAEDIFPIFMQASLTHVGARAIAEDAGYSVDELKDSPPERAAKEQMRRALSALDEATDEIERAMSAAEAEQELPEGVALLARHQRRAV